MHDLAQPRPCERFQPERGVHAEEHDFVDAFEHRVGVMRIDEPDEVAEILVRHEDDHDGEPVAHDLEKAEIVTAGQKREPNHDEEGIDERTDDDRGTLDGGAVFYR